MLSVLDPVQGTKEQARATEQQAIGRAHRQGQKNTVKIVRFVVRDTIEHEQLLRVMDAPLNTSGALGHVARTTGYSLP